MDAMLQRYQAIALSCFNPRARDGRDSFCVRLGMGSLVSIHAPVMDAILRLMSHASNQAVSIHAPVMDAIHHCCDCVL